jgi:hypothetical protein
MKRKLKVTDLSYKLKLTDHSYRSDILACRGYGYVCRHVNVTDTLASRHINLNPKP